jgi:hypothetical protein
MSKTFMRRSRCDKSTLRKIEKILRGGKKSKRRHAVGVHGEW